VFVAPLFVADDPLCRDTFHTEPETIGGRLTWQSFPAAEMMIADTNGHYRSPAAPGALDLELVTDPQDRNVVVAAGSVRVSFRAAPRTGDVFARVPHGDLRQPDDGAFLAQLTAQQPYTSGYLIALCTYLGVGPQGILRFLPRAGLIPAASASSSHPVQSRIPVRLR
jgi:hypothetical protein